MRYGIPKVETLITIVRDGEDARLPKAARFALTLIAQQIDVLEQQIDTLERSVVAEVKSDDEA